MRDVIWLVLLLEAAQSLLIHPPENQRHLSVQSLSYRSNLLHTSSSSLSPSLSGRRCHGRRRPLLCAETKSDDPSNADRINIESNVDSLAASHHNKPLEEDIAKRLSLSRDRAISALSQPNAGQQSGQQQPQENIPQSSILPLPPPSLSKKQQQHQQQQAVRQQQQQQQHQLPRDQRRSSSNRATLKRNFKKPHPSAVSTMPPSSSSSLLPPPINSKQQDDESSQSIPPSSNNNNRNNSPRRTQAKRQPYSSLLPPPLPREDTDEQDSTNDDDDVLSYGLSSWEEFLGGGKRNKKKADERASSSSTSTVNPMPTTSGKDRVGNPASDSKAPDSLLGSGTKDPPITISRLPSIRELFPPEAPPPKPPSAALTSPKSGTTPRTASSATKASSSPFDGILPVSDLFYRSSQSIEASDDDGDESIDEDGVSQENDDYDDDENVPRRGDDEELPFSAEQSDQLTTEHNKIRIRRNTAAMSVHAKLEAAVAAPTSAASSKRSSKGTTGSSSASKSPRRKGINRMVRRGMEMLVGGVPINADPPQRCIELIYQPLEEVGDWSRVITLNSRDFGPLLDSSTAHMVTEVEKGLFCEYFVQAAMKWDVCPKDLRDIVKQHCVGQALSNVAPKTSSASVKSSLFNQKERGKSAKSSNEDGDEENILSLMKLVDEDVDQSPSINGNNKKQASGETPSKQSPSRKKDQEDETFFRFGGDLVFDIGVSREELESGEGGEHGGIVRQVLARGISAAIDKELKGFLVHIATLVMTDKDDGTTSISAEFCLQPEEPMSYQQAKQRYQRVKASLAQAMDDGDMQLAMAAAAREETRWSESIRDRVVEEFLFEEDEVPYDEEQEQEVNTPNRISDNDDLTESEDDEEDGPLVSNDDLFIGGGSDGVFYDYSAANIMNSPFQGELGPHLVEAVLERVKQRPPRVIAIGDVHGCIDELQDLLRQCDYQPGDLVVFLGDMVSKGPDSSSVVQMAREIGAIGVRGNHDFEVIRWHQAIKSGVDPPVVGSEHFHVASCLSKADMKWLYSLPWYISSKELGALFVHAGFVSGIRLAKQNPRLMMNMRSILPDGTVTSKFFNNWPWARLWDGPQTVLFGHDADRGLQQYEHAIGLDTGCVYGGRLTACILPEKRLVSVSAKREYFKYRRKHYE